MVKMMYWVHSLYYHCLLRKEAWLCSTCIYMSRIANSIGLIKFGLRAAQILGLSGQLVDIKANTCEFNFYFKFQAQQSGGCETIINCACHSDDDDNA